MANRFDKIFPREEYVPVIQPLPYDMLYGMGKDLQNEQDKNVLDNLKLQELWKNVKADPADYQHLTALDKEYTPEFTRVSDLAFKGDPKAKQEMYALAAKFQTDPRIRILEHNYTLGQQARKEYMDLQHAGKTSQLGWSNQWEAAERSRNGKLTPIPFTAHAPWSNPHDDANKVIGNISPDLKEWGREGFDVGPNGKFVIRGAKGKQGGIEEKRVMQEAMYGLDAFSRSPGGISLMKDLRAAGVNDPAQMQKEMLNFLYSSGHKQVHTNTGNFSTVSNAADKYDPVTTLSTFEETEPMDLEAAGIPEAYELLPGVSKDMDIPNPGYAELYSESQEPNTKTTWRNAYDNLGEKKKETYNRIVSVALPDVAERMRRGTATDEDFKQANFMVYKAAKSISGGKIFSYYEGYDPEKRDSITNDTFGKKNISLKEVGSAKFINRSFYDPRTNKVMSGQQFYDDVVTSDLKKNGDMMIQVTGENRGTSPVSLLTGDNNFDLSRMVSVGGKTYIMSSAAREREISPYGIRDLKDEATTNNIYYNMQWGLPEVKSENYNVNHYTGNTTTKEYIEGEDGKPVEVGETTYDPKPDPETGKPVWKTNIIINGKPFFYKTNSPETIKLAINKFIIENSK